MAHDNNDTVEGLLERAREALNQQQAEQAAELAREALQLQPGEPRASNLLGLALLHQGNASQARSVFQSLVGDHPDVAPLQTNLGLAALSEGDLDVALDAFRRAIDLTPSDARAFGYLAMVHLQLGEAGFAAAALQEAGLLELADRLEQEEGEAVAQALEQGVRALPAPRPSAAHQGFVPSADLPQELQLGQQAVDPNEVQEATREITVALDQALGGEVRRLRQPAQTLEIPEVARNIGGPGEHVPAVEPHARSLDVPEQGDELTLRHRTAIVRLDTPQSRDGVILDPSLLLLERGTVTLTEAHRRRKGLQRDPFVLPGGSALLRAEGDGQALLHAAPGRQFQVIRLERNGVYLREEALVAFADRLFWDNGHIPATGDDTPGIVALRGSGFVLAQLSGRLWSVSVSEDSPVAVPLARLFAWSPKAVPTGMAGATGSPRVGFRGTGVVWLDLPA